MRVILIRSTEIFNDSRASKEIITFLKNNFQVTVLGWNRKNNNFSNKELKVNDNIANIYLYNKSCNYADGMKSLFKMLGFQLFVFLKLLKYRKNYDVIHCCDFDTTLTAKFIAKIFKKKFVYDIYDYYVECHSLGKLKNTIEKMDIKTINKADLTIICTEQRKEQIAKSSPKKTIVIHNTPDINLTKEEKIIKSKTNKIKIAYVGILQDFRLLKEIGETIKKHEDIELHIGGFGRYENYFKELSNKHKNIYYYGSLEYSKVLSLENDCDILFATYDPQIPNHRYSAPNKVYEAMALCKPIIVCNNTGIDKLVLNEKIGTSINYDANEFIDAVYKLKDVKHYNDIAKRTNKLYNNKYNWKLMEEKLIKAYKEI